MNRLTKTKLLIASVAFLLVNLALTILLFRLDNSTYTNLDGTEVAPQSAELIQSVIFGQLVSVPIFSVLIGLIIAIFIERELPYSKRISKAFLLTITFIYGIFTVMGAIKVLTFL